MSPSVRNPVTNHRSDWKKRNSFHFKIYQKKTPIVVVLGRVDTPRWTFVSCSSPCRRVPTLMPLQNYEPPCFPMYLNIDHPSIQLHDATFSDSPSSMHATNSNVWNALHNCFSVHRFAVILYIPRVSCFVTEGAWVYGGSRIGVFKVTNNNC